MVIYIRPNRRAYRTKRIVLRFSTLDPHQCACKAPQTMLYYINCKQAGVAACQRKIPTFKEFAGLPAKVDCGAKAYVFAVTLHAFPPAGDERDSKGMSPFGAVRAGRLPGEGNPRPTRRRRKGVQRGEPLWRCPRRTPARRGQAPVPPAGGCAVRTSRIAASAVRHCYSLFAAPGF